MPSQTSIKVDEPPKTVNPQILVDVPSRPSEPELADDGYTSTDSATKYPLDRFYWRLHQAKTPSYATDPDVTQYWHWAASFRGTIGHQFLHGPTMWSPYTSFFSFHLSPDKTTQVLFSRGSTLVLIEKFILVDNFLRPAGNVMAQFKRDRTKRRFLSFLRQVRWVDVVEVDK